MKPHSVDVTTGDVPPRAACRPRRKHALRLGPAEHVCPTSTHHTARLGFYVASEPSASRSIGRSHGKLGRYQFAQSQRLGSDKLRLDET